MRRGVMAVAGLAMLAACHKEPSFEERYDAASEKVSQRAKEIDAQISASATSQAGGLQAETQASGNPEPR